MQIQRTLPLALVMLSFICSVEAYSQTRKRPNASTPTRTASVIQKRRVILDLVAQEPIAADFIQADASSITVEINGARRVFQMEEVVGVIFSPDEANKRLSQTASRQGLAQVQEALKALRKLNSATSVGISLMQYGQLLVDAKASLDEALATMPVGELRNELALSMQAYVDAKEVWNVIITKNAAGILYWRKQLKEQYQVPDKLEVKGMVFHPLELDEFSLDIVLNYLWKNARAHLDNASSRLTQ